MARRRSTRGSITQRGKGSWRVGFRAGSGTRVRETVRGTKADAERRLTELLREYDVTGLVPDREATVSSFSKTWLEHVGHRVKPTTLKGYRELLELHVVPVIGPVRMSELRPAAVQAVITKVLDARSPRTAVNTYRVLSEMLGVSRQVGRDGVQPCRSRPATTGTASDAPRPRRRDVCRDPGSRSRSRHRGTGRPGARDRDAAGGGPGHAVARR